MIAIPSVITLNKLQESQAMILLMIYYLDVDP